MAPKERYTPSEKEAQFLATVQNGKYGEKGDFRHSIRNREKQEMLHSQESLVRSAEFLAKAVEAAREQLDIGVNVIPAAELVGQRFIILSAKPFESRFEGQEFAYFCVCTDLKRSEMWGTVLGGGQPVSFITDYIGKGAPAPLGVTLVEKEGGRYGKYYVLE